MMCRGCHCGHYCPCCGRQLAPSPYWYPRPFSPWMLRPKIVAPYAAGLGVNTAVSVGRQVLQG